MNTTTNLPPALYKLRDVFAAQNPYRDILWIFPMLLALSPRFWHTLKDNAFARAYKMQYSIFALHVGVSFIELVKYYSQIWLTGGVRPLPSDIDLILCLIQCWTSLYITSRHHLLPRAALEVTRATFQCMSLQRLIALFMCKYTGDVRWYQANISLLNNFMWARVIIQSRVTGFRWKYKYVVGIVGSHLLGMYNGNYPHGIAIYCALMLALLHIERWTKKHESNIARLLRYLGFATPIEFWKNSIGGQPQQRIKDDIKDTK